MNTVHLHDLLDPVLLAQMLEEGHVKIQFHPGHDLKIYNYTARAQYEHVWNDVTRRCRGLITDLDDNVVARPFPKFFNHGELEADSFPSGPVTVTDKLDGSLGILYPVRGGHAVATRGSFASTQAVHATKVYNDRYAGSFEPNPAWTYLFEIIYPQNRIVVDYHGLDDIVLLAAVDIETGVSIPLADARKGWPGRVVEEFDHADLASVLASVPRANAEGLVIHFLADDSRVKVKQSDYVRLHRLVTGVSERRIWEALSEGVDLNEWLEAVPDEFHALVSTTRAKLERQFHELSAELEDRYRTLVANLPEGWGRRDFAQEVTAAQASYPLARGMFLLLDGRAYDHLVWNQIRPIEHIPLFSINEDTN